MAKSIKLKDKNGYVYPYPYFPIGYIYISVLETNPSTFFGGTWEQIKDTFLLACGDIFMAGSTGGEKEHILTTQEMPAHRHSMTARYGTDANSTNASNVGQPQTANSTTPRVTIPVDVINLTGEGLAHNNMPPYLAIYMWKRIG